MFLSRQFIPSYLVLRTKDPARNFDRTAISSLPSCGQLDYPAKLREAVAILGVLPHWGGVAAREVDVGSAISSLIFAVERGDGPAAEVLFAALYSELHQLAKLELVRCGLQEDLSATPHEAYLDMAARDGPSFPDRARFMGYAARVMRGLIIDHARERHAQKRGGQFEIFR